MSTPTLSLAPGDLIRRQPEDSDLDYARLLEYAGLPGSQRDPAALGARWGMTRGSVIGQIRGWALRVEPWDLHLQRQVTAAMVTAVEETTRELAAEHARIWADVRAVGRRVLDRLLESDGEDLSPSQALAFLDTSFKAERLIAGESTAHVGVAIRALDLGALSLGEQRQLRELLAKAGASD